MASVEEKKAGRIVVAFESILVQVTTFLFYSLVYFAEYTPGFTRTIRFQGLGVTLPGCSSVGSVPSVWCYFDLWDGKRGRWGERERKGVLENFLTPCRTLMSSTQTWLFYIWNKRELVFGEQHYFRIGITVTGLCQTYRFLFKYTLTVPPSLVI